MPAAPAAAAPSPPSPARQRLADAISRHRAAADRIAVLERALDSVRESRIEAFLAVEQAEEALRGAEADRPAALVRALVDGAGEVDPVEAAERQLDRARAGLNFCRDQETALTAAIADAQKTADWDRRAMRAALGDAIRTLPEVARLIEEFDRARAIVVDLTDALAALRERDALPVTWDALIAVGRPLPPVSQPAAPAWRAALEAIEVDPGAALPSETP